MMRTFLAIIGLLTTPMSTWSRAEDLKALKEDYAAKAAVVETLRELVLEQVEIKDEPIAEAINALNRILEREKQPRVNCVVRIPRLESVGADPFAADDYVPWRPKPVTIQEDEISFAFAVDRACQQAGFRWMIEINEITKVPFLVVIPDYGGD